MDQKVLYFTDFHLSAIRSVITTQRLNIPRIEKAGTLKSDEHCRYRDFTISTKYRKEWIDLMRVRENAEYVPFSFHWPWLIEVLVKDLLPGLGLNLKNYLHVGQKAEYFTPYSDDPDMRYTLALSLIDLCPIDREKMAIVSEANIHNRKGETILKSIDYSIVRNMTGKELQFLLSLPYANNHDVSLLKKGLSKTPARFARGGNMYGMEFYVNQNMGIQYGCVSGALNTAHTFKTLSPLFGHSKPFLQGMCTGNLIMSLIGVRFAKHMKSIELYFNNKLFNPMNVELRFDDESFELFDERNVMVSSGKYRLAE